MLLCTSSIAWSDDLRERVSDLETELLVLAALVLEFAATAAKWETTFPLRSSFLCCCMKIGKADLC